MKLEIEQPPAGEEDDWRHWIVLEQLTDGDVSISRDYQRPGEERSTWCDEGITIRAADVAQVTTWLSQLPSPSGDEK